MQTHNQIKLGQIELRKYHLIQEITAVQDEALISRLEELFREVNAEYQNLSYYIKPLRKTTDIQQLIEEQNFHSFDRKGFDQLIEEIDIPESLDEILVQLNP